MQTNPLQLLTDKYPNWVPLSVAAPFLGVSPRQLARLIADKREPFCSIGTDIGIRQHYCRVYMGMLLDRRDVELLRLIGLCKDIPADCSPIKREMFTEIEFKVLTGAGYIRKSKSGLSYRLAEKGYEILNKLEFHTERDKYPVGNDGVLRRRLEAAKVILTLYSCSISVFDEPQEDRMFVPTFSFRRKAKGSVLGASKMCGVLKTAHQTVIVYFINKTIVLSVNAEISAIQRVSAVLQSPSNLVILYLGDNSDVLESFNHPFEIRERRSLWDDSLAAELKWPLYEPEPTPMEISMYD